MFYVYIITNLINGKKYIGMSINKKPWHLKTYYGSGKLIKQAIKKYGKENFKKEIIKEFDNESDTRLFEKKLIEDLRAIDDPMYYNLCAGGYGGGVKGHVVSEETKEKLRNHFTGKKRPDEVVKKISEKLRGKKPSVESISKRKIGLRRYYDNLSEEDKIEMFNRYRQLSETNKGKTHSDETKDKLSKINSKLTKEQVKEIVRLVENKEMTYKQISEIFGINQSCICNIVKKRSYKWVWKE